LIINLYLDRREHTHNARDARLLRDTTSALISGVLRGYGRVNFSISLGWDFLSTNLHPWIPAIGFLTGTDALQLTEEFPDSSQIDWLDRTVVPALIAVEQLENKFQGQSFILARLSRVTLSDPVQLELTLTASRADAAPDIVVGCYFESVVADRRAIEDALGLRATVLVGRFSDAVRNWIDSNDDRRVVDVGDNVDEDNLRNIAQLIRTQIEHQGIQRTAGTEARFLRRNYAKDFPLEDPEFRRLFLVERHSVKQLLEQLDLGTGIHLWCSVRRSGKTTAVVNLADVTGRSAVIVQTMDHQPNQLELNILESRIRTALEARASIGPNFFQDVINECLLSAATIQADKKKIVLVIDEYESLFGLMEAFTRSEPDLRYLVVQPILSQMVAFAVRNLLVLMGQRPDAHFILSSQNQLSPLVRQHSFPLFEHYAGALNTEYAQFVRRVLTEKLSFDTGFVDATYFETGGHPYLTVNLLVDLCDWLIANRTIEAELHLDAQLFHAFVQERLSPGALQRSPYYSFFQRMLADYLSERSRRQESWLHAVAVVLQQISKQHPRALACSLVNYQKIAEPVGPIAQLTPDQLLLSATMSNFLTMDGGHIKPAIRLMGRLAASVIPRMD
jgi:hypothetical protein